MKAYEWLVWSLKSNGSCNCWAVFAQPRRPLQAAQCVFWQALVSKMDIHAYEVTQTHAHTHTLFFSLSLSSPASCCRSRAACWRHYRRRQACLCGHNPLPSWSRQPSTSVRSGPGIPVARHCHPGRKKRTKKKMSDLRWLKAFLPKAHWIKHQTPLFYGRWPFFLFILSGIRTGT